MQKVLAFTSSHSLVLDQGNEFLIEDAAFAKPSNLQKIKGSSSKFFATASKTFMLIAVYQ